MVLAVVGSVQLHNHPEAYRTVQRVYNRLRPTRVISGGAVGVDTIAEREARRREIPVTIHKPHVQNWARGFKPRNILIANDCDHLVRIAAQWASTYGSGWTRDYVKKLGKPTEEYVVDNPAQKICGTCTGIMMPTLQYLTPPHVVWQCEGACRSSFLEAVYHEMCNPSTSLEVPLSILTSPSQVEGTPRASPRCEVREYTR